MVDEPKRGADVPAAGDPRAKGAKKAREARHMAPKGSKDKRALANLFKAERRAEQTTSFQALTEEQVENAKHASLEDLEAQAPSVESAEETAQVSSADDATVEASSNGAPSDPASTSAHAEEGERDAGETVVAPLPASSSPSHAAPKEPKKHLSKKAVWGIVGGCAAALVAIYVGVALFFTNTFMPNTTVNGRDVSLMGRQELIDSLEQRSIDYSLAVSGDGLNFTVEGADIGLGFDSDAYAAKAIEATQPWSWPVSVWTPRDIDAETGQSIDQEKLSAIVEEQVSTFNEKAKSPVNATIAYDDATDKFVVKPEEMGTLLDEGAVLSDVTRSINAFSDAVVLDETALAKPEITSDNERLLAAQNQANSFLTTEVTLKMNGETAEVIGPDRVKDWVVVDDSLNPTLNQEAITEWGKNDLSSRLDTVNRERTYTRADGKTISVNGGSYGWSIDSAALTPLVVDAVMSGKSQEVDVPILQSAQTVPDEGGRDWGMRYIDVDLSEQHVRMYGDDGSLIWEAPCVSGDDSQSHNTPTGVWYIDSNFNKTSPSSTLVGYKPDGTKDYESYVRYWMPFIGNSIGLHDADWRGSFGGSIYLYNGSHGCVNLPVSAAGELCKIVNQGDVVITHY